MMPMLVSSLALAAPDVVVVGLHVPDRSVEQALEDAARFAEALERAGRMEVGSPEDAARALAGREALVIDAYALGPGRDKLREGRVLYDRAQPEDAIPVLEDAARLLSAGLALRPDARDLREALLLLAMSHYALGDENAARDAFRRAATLSPDQQLDAVNYPPDAIALYDGERERLTSARPATVSLVGAEGSVSVDGRSAGNAPTDLSLVPGQHHLLISGDAGRWSSTVTVKSGQTREIEPELRAPALGTAASEASARSRQVRDLYRGLGQYTDGAILVLAGTTANGQVAVQLYDTGAGSFSRAVTQEPSGDPVDTLVDLASDVVDYLDDGGVRADRVSPSVASLDVGANPVLADLLLNPSERSDDAATGATARSRVPWFVWAGVGALAAGGGAAAVVVATSGADEPVDGSGTVVFGPVP